MKWVMLQVGVKTLGKVGGDNNNEKDIQLTKVYKTRIQYNK
jgi:hypothetical protein